MQIIFEADLNKMTEELQELSPERFLRILAVAVKNMAKQNAHEAGKGGKSFWQREILPSIREEVSPDHFSVYSDSYIAAHIHHGGEIKPKNSQFLAQIVRTPSQKHAADLETPQGHNPNIYKKNTNIANYCLLFSLFKYNFNQNIYYRAQITLTLKNFHKQIIYTYKRFKKHICTTKCLFLHIIFIFRQRIKMEHRFFDSRPLQ